MEIRIGIATAENLRLFFFDERKKRYRPESASGEGTLQRYKHWSGDTDRGGVDMSGSDRPGCSIDDEVAYQFGKGIGLLRYQHEACAGRLRSCRLLDFVI